MAERTVFKKEGMIMDTVKILLNNLLPVFSAIMCLIAAFMSMSIVKETYHQRRRNRSRNKSVHVKINNHEINYLKTLQKYL